MLTMRNIFVVLLFFLPACMWCQTELKYRNLTTEDGLPSNYIINMVQDPQGYIWMATANGLCRHDGYSFDVLKHEKEGNNALLLNDRIRELHQNKNGLLFIRLQGERYSCYDTRRRRFVDFTTRGDNARNYCDCYFTPDGDTWLWYTYTGCLEVKYRDGKIEANEYSERNGKLASNNVRTVFGDSHHRVWICTAAGLYVKESGKEMRRVNERPMTASVAEVADRVYFVTQDQHLVHVDRQGRLHDDVSAYVSLADGDMIRGLAALGKKLMMLTNATTYLFDTQSGTLEKSSVQLPGGKVYTDNLGNTYICDQTVKVCYISKEEQKPHTFSILAPAMLNKRGVPPYKLVTDHDGNVWVSTIGNGLWLYDPATRQLTHYKPEAGDVSPVRTDYLYGVLCDKSGNVWVSQENMGLSLITAMPRGVRRLFATRHDTPHYSNFFRCLRQTSDGRIWAGDFMKGSYQLDRRAASLNRINIGVDDDLLSVCIDGDGHTWVGTRHDGVGVDGRFYRNSPDDDSSIARGKVFDIMCDSRHRVWITVNTGALCLALPQSDGSYRFRRFLTEDPFLSTLTVMHQTRRGIIFVGCANGLVAFNPDRLAADPKAFHYYNSKNSSLGYYEIRDIFEDRQGCVWLASVGGGLYRIADTADISQLQFEQFTSDHGLADNTVNSIIADKHGDLWMGTDNGLSRLQLASMQFTNYYLSADPLGEVYSENSSCLLADGTLVFATNNGIVCFNPDDARLGGGSTGTLAVTNLLVNGMPFYDDSDDADNVISLSHRQNTLTFRFSDMRFDFPHRTEYEYQLDGFDRRWSLPTRQNEAVYKDLHPGEYTFRVRISGGKEQKEATVRVVISQPWWNTWWAWLFYLVVVGSVAWYILRLLKVTYSMRNRIRMDREISDFKQRFFMDVSHEFRTPLTLIQGSMERMRKAGELPSALKQPVSNMARSTDRLLRLINQLLEFHKLQNGKFMLKLQETDVIKMLRDITLSFNDMAQNRQMSLQFIPFAQRFITYVDRGYVDKIMYNLLSNAFKYTPRKGSVVVRVRHLEQQRLLAIVVEDTGVGVPKEKQGQLFTRFMQTNMSADSIGIGLNFTEQLVLAHHGSIEYHDNPVGGSIFTVMLPATQEVYQPEDYLNMVDSLDEVGDAETMAATATAYKELQVEPLNNRRVLVVEDDEDVREYVSAEQGRYFYVVKAQDGVEAMEILRSSAVDLVVSDIKMPQMDGLELLKQVRADDNLFDVPFILLTAISTVEKQLQGMRYGADAYIPKPFSPSMLVTRSVALLKQHERLKQAYSRTSDKLTSDDRRQEGSDKFNASDKLQAESDKCDNSHPSEPLITAERDRKFREIVDMKIQSNLSNPDFLVDDLAHATGYGRSQFYSKMVEITGKTPKEYIRDIRMARAAELLREGGAVSISEVAYQVGFSDPLYFSRCFKQHFGMTPSKYQKG